MDSLRRKRIRQVAAVTVFAGVLGAMIAYHILRPAPADPVVQQFSETIIGADPETLPEDEREVLRAQWDRMSPETREAVFQEVARSRLEAMRRETAQLPQEERLERVRQELQRMRRRRRRLTQAEADEVSRRLQTAEGKRMVKNVLDFFQNELTARERAELDPLLHEWLWQLRDLGRRQR